MKNIDLLIRKADSIAIKEVERLARNVLKANNKTHKFTMAMGTYFFQDKDGEILYNFESKRLNNFIMEYDSMLKLTGNPMMFTAKSKITTDW